MFLIEDPQCAILYTGDVRSETWWINSLVRNPIILPYTLGAKRLDKLYLDTTFATKDGRYRRFPSKAAGIKELLEKVSRYPQHTVFHFHAWTLGYEDVWIALSSVLDTRVHVDDYKCQLYGSLASEIPNGFQHHEGPALVGFKNGNHFQQGCLTSEKSVRLHSCEHGTGCPASSSSSTVYIIPVMNRGDNGEIIPEKGAGGGGGDLLQNHGYLELNDRNLTKLLVDLCDERAKNPTIRSQVRDIIIEALGNDNKAISLDAFAPWQSDGNIELDRFVKSLMDLAGSSKPKTLANIGEPPTQKIGLDGTLPSRIQFPYARHSSYEELCELVAAFRPFDIYPCTTDWQEWTWDKGVEYLFGHLCSGTTFAHDQEMAGLESQREFAHSLKRPLPSQESRETSSSPTRLLGIPQVTGLVTDISTKEPSACVRQQDLEFIDKDNVRLSKRRIQEIRRSFERTLRAVKEPVGMDSTTYQPRGVAYQATSRNDKAVSPKYPLGDGDLEELALYRSFSAQQRTSGTQAEPIELSDDGSLTFDSQNPGNVSLDVLLQPDSAAEADVKEHSRSESQTSLSDTAFESQLTNMSAQEREAQIQTRRHAYKAAKDPSGAWAAEYSLISLRADHRGEEFEL